jgi:uncharacterized protein
MAPLLPDVADPLMAPFWEGLRAGVVHVQQCDDCGRRAWPAAVLCPVCLSSARSWSPVSGRGRIWSHAIYRRALSPAFADDVPYAVAVVALEEEPDLHILARLQGVPDRTVIGESVEACFRAVSDSVTLLEWRVR